MTSARSPRIQEPCSCIELAQGKGEGITTAVVVAAFGAICVAGVLVALWARPAAARGRARRQGARAGRQPARRDRRADLGCGATARRARGTASAPRSARRSISTEVLQRTLAATEALPAVDGSRVSVRRPDGTVTTAVRGRVVAGPGTGARRPTGRRAFVSGLASWDVAGTRRAADGPRRPARAERLRIARRLLAARERLRQRGGEHPQRRSRDGRSRRCRTRSATSRCRSSRQPTRARGSEARARSRRRCRGRSAPPAATAARCA